MAKGDTRLRKSLSDRFHDKIAYEPNSGCWLWTGAINTLGYGLIGLGHRSDGIAKAHRVSYELHNGEIPTGLCVLHRCDNPYCVNPDHLFVGTLSDNMKDCVQKKRNFIPDNRAEKATWAKLTKENVLHIKEREMTGLNYAKLYSVSKSTIFSIWSGKNWQSV